jgi:4'-phosphopantetheinyl transferase
LQRSRHATFPNFNFSASHQGDYVGIASEPRCLVGLDIVSVSEPRGEAVADFIRRFSPHLTEHEWNRVVHAGTPSQVLTEFYRYCIFSPFQIWFVVGHSVVC